MKFNNAFSSIFRKIFLLVVLLLCGTQFAMAYSGVCTPDNGTMEYNYNIGNITVIDQARNRPGYLFQRPYQWNYGQDYAASCDCDPNVSQQQTFFKGDTPLPLGHNDGERQFFKVNDYLEVTSIVVIKGYSYNNQSVPFTDVSNFYASKACTTDPDYTNHKNWKSGGSGNVSLYISKPFVGVSYISKMNIVNVYATQIAGNYSAIPLSSVYLTGQITVPQNCIIDAGQLITVDFGKIWSGDITTIGQKPAGYVNKQIKASMKCNNIAAYTNLTLRFESEVSPNYPDAIKTDNPDVGVELFDENGKLILPNTGLMPFHIDDNYEATVSFQVAPVSTTGNVPTAGQFKALAYIRVDFA
ncbi:MULTISPECIES: fimbrial protein [Lelliottia]|uniref:Fimbrial-type adhesion domain-containing protein n=1 Tax=Lelliottia aquatilis TaxID=2080838 RepID=A0ABX4ZZR8_9ENTR|nr:MULTISPECIES: fimbrial protein [Lelliottia]NTZ45397.1 hypothetical protein [Lelliottia aquatilis]POZ19095.1 hypothetical protein C3708_16060 [Lelliottia sp. 7254-16]POZ21959.1 hypothetical protein C3712_14085 [Lelliottia aquatilis]POZ24573.1 hypothetical protein C3711_14830 [Lelliottia aquatilis]POZ31844.1 hypothetical protein C3710_15475 [Lelliottia aquatilis]